MRTPQPRMVRAVLADARVTAANQGRPIAPGSKLRAALEAVRLAYLTDAFLGQALYRAESRLRSLGVPLLPRLLRALVILVCQIRVDPEAVLQPGVYFPHGQNLIRGGTRVDLEVVIAPFAEIGPAEQGGGAPRIGRGARIGTGSRVVGEITIGEGARIGANALVRESVPAGATAVGVPARIIPARER